jgi:hypothetical protein
MENNYPTKRSKNADLIPTEDEIREILSQIFEAQAEQNHRKIKDLPVVILKAWVSHTVLKAFNKTRRELYKSSDDFLAEMDKIIRRLEDSME